MKKKKKMSKFATLLQFAKYAVVGAFGTVIHYLILIVLVSSSLTNPVIASITGALTGAIVNYFLNVKITFKTEANLLSIRRFALIALVGAALNGLLMAIGMKLLTSNYLVVQCVATSLVLGLTYVVNSRWTFQRTVKTTRDGA